MVNSACLALVLQPPEPGTWKNHGHLATAMPRVTHLTLCGPRPPLSLRLLFRKMRNRVILVHSMTPPPPTLGKGR